MGGDIHDQSRSQVAAEVTAVAPVKLVPVIVTTVPPALDPEVGESDVNVGAFS